jgi:hypothetical protein
MFHAWGKAKCIGIWWEDLRKEPLDRLRRRWKDKIKMDIREVRWGHGFDRSGSE